MYIRICIYIHIYLHSQNILQSVCNDQKDPQIAMSLLKNNSFFRHHLVFNNDVTMQDVSAA